MRTLTKANVVRVIEIVKSLGLTPHTLGMDDKYFNVQKNHTKMIENSTHFLGKEDIDLRHRKKTNRRKEALHMVLLKQPYFVHCLLKLP